MDSISVRKRIVEQGATELEVIEQARIVSGTARSRPLPELIAALADLRLAIEDLDDVSR